MCDKIILQNSYNYFVMAFFCMYTTKSCISSLLSPFHPSCKGPWLFLDGCDKLMLLHKENKGDHNKCVLHWSKINFVDNCITARLVLSKNDNMINKNQCSIDSTHINTIVPLSLSHGKSITYNI